MYARVHTHTHARSKMDFKQKYTIRNVYEKRLHCEYTSQRVVK